MPKNSAQLVSGFLISGASKLPCARAVTTPSVLRGASAGNGLSVTALAEDRLAQPRLVIETERGDNGAMRVPRADQALPLQRRPDRGIAQSAGVAGRDHGVAEVEMIAVRIGRVHGNARFLS